jgi:hypothetical protein
MAAADKIKMMAGGVARRTGSLFGIDVFMSTPS